MIDFKDIKSHRNGREWAFEELSYQIFEKEKGDGKPVIRRDGSGGDGGIEAYVADHQGRVIVGLQAKYFINGLRTQQWAQLDKSVLTTLKRNQDDCVLREYIITLPINLSEKQQNNWGRHVTKWKEEATRLGYVDIEFTLWSESKLRLFLEEERLKGHRLYWFGFPDFDLSSCKKVTSWTLKGLINHYSPHLHTRTETERAIHAFLRSERFRLEYISEAKALAAEARKVREITQKCDIKDKIDLSQVEKEWNELMLGFGDGISIPPSLSKLTAHCAKLRDLLENSLTQLKPTLPQQKEDTARYYGEKSHLEKAFDHIRIWQSKVYEFAEFLDQNSQADKQCLLITGKAGVGKSHLLAEICQHYSEQGGAVIFLSGHTFPKSQLCHNSFLNLLGFQGTIDDFFEVFATLGKTTPLPALICIDALNESPDRDVWRTGLFNFSERLREYKNIKLIVSCREDYLPHTVPEILRQKKSDLWSTIKHRGLEQNLFEAIPKFFRYYGIKECGVPVFLDEFRNPLFLKIFCETFKGQRPLSIGLTLPKLLDEYFKRKSEDIADTIRCRPEEVQDALTAITKAMRKANSSVIDAREAQKITRSIFPEHTSDRSLYQALLAAGIFFEIPGVRGFRGEPDRVRFTYERIWDYLLSCSYWKHGTQPDQNLKKLILNKEWRKKNPGVLAILSIRFPEELKVELLTWIGGYHDAVSDLLDPFFASIPWRTTSTYLPQTRNLLDRIIDITNFEHSLDFLLELACNPEHPLNADWLHTELLQLTLPERDRKWTPIVNRTLFYKPAENSIAKTLIQQAYQLEPNILSEKQKLLLATTLAWFLATTFVEERDRITTCLTKLLIGNLSLTAQLVERFTYVNDPYVKERVLCAAAKVAEGESKKAEAGLKQLAALVYDSVFAKDEVEPNIIIRHYAREICEHALSQPARFRRMWSPRNFVLPILQNGRISGAKRKLKSSLTIQNEKTAVTFINFENLFSRPVQLRRLGTIRHVIQGNRIFPRKHLPTGCRSQLQRAF